MESKAVSLKEFWDKIAYHGSDDLLEFIRDDYKEKLGLFFWERGGKQFVERIAEAYYNRQYNIIFEWTTMKELIDYAENIEKDCIYTQSFLDCLDCLEEDKVKELIKELSVNGK